MDAAFILISFREFKNWQPEDVAKKIFVGLQEYRNLENGLNSVDEEVALKLSELYQAPLQFFLSGNPSPHLSIVYTHCHFENSNGYVNHLYQQDGELLAKDESIKLLKEEVKRLREQNELLLKKLLV